MRHTILALALLLVGTPASANDLDDQVHGIGIDLGNVENAINRLEREVHNPVARSRFYPLEKRLVDARVYFELKNYAKAAVMYIDASSYRQFKTHPERADVLFRLGYSLFKLKNYLAARQYLQACVSTLPPAPIYNKALRYLIEIGLATRGNKGLEKAVQQVSRATNRSPESQYAFAKGLYRLGRTQEALTALGAIPGTTPQFVPAQYYTAVILTERKRFKEAIGAFKRVVAVPAKSSRQKLIRELAFMGVGRLHLEMKNFSGAIDAYQEIPHHSKNFHTALYEMTWAYVHNKQFDKALHSLEVLLLTVENDQLATQANILRGRLNIMLDQTDLAVEAYQEIVRRFSPLRKELDTFARKGDALAAYFRWLLQRRTDEFQLGAVVSERASKWIEDDEQLSDLVSMFDDMAYQRRDVKEAESVLKELERALAAGNRVEIFPNLKSAWTRIIVAENKLIGLSQRTLDSEGRLARARMSEEERAKLDAMLAKRTALEKRFADLPRTVQQYRNRKQTVHRRYADLRRESFLLETSLKTVRRELRAMEKWINEAKYAEKQGSKKIDPTQIRKLTGLLNAEKRKMLRLHKELTTLKTQITQQNAGVGAGDRVSRNEQALRRKLLDAHTREQALLNRVLGRLSGGERATAEQLRAIRGRIVGDFTRLGKLLGRINGAVAIKVADYRRQVAAERKLLRVYRREVAGFDRQSSRIAKEIGQPLFREAHKRLTEVVLEADLGLVDVAWKRKTAESGKILALQKEQSEQMRHLEETMREILQD